MNAAVDQKNLQKFFKKEKKLVNLMVKLIIGKI